MTMHFTFLKLLDRTLLYLSFRGGSNSVVCSHVTLSQLRQHYAVM